MPYFISLFKLGVILLIVDCVGFFIVCFTFMIYDLDRQMGRLCARKTGLITSDLLPAPNQAIWTMYFSLFLSVFVCLSFGRVLTVVLYNVSCYPFRLSCNECQ